MTEWQPTEASLTVRGFYKDSACDPNFWPSRGYNRDGCIATPEECAKAYQTLMMRGGGGYLDLTCCLLQAGVSGNPWRIADAMLQRARKAGLIEFCRMYGMTFWSQCDPRTTTEPANRIANAGDAEPEAK